MNANSQFALRREDYVNALKDLDTFVDVSLEELMQINDLAHKHAQLRQANQLTVRDIMTADVATVTADTSLRDAARMLLDLRISGLPVIDAERRPVGIVTEADFLSVMGITSHDRPHSLWQTLESMFRHEPSVDSAPATVADIMAPRVITVLDDQTVHDVISTMKRHYIKRVVVTNAGGTIQGIVTRSNLVKVLLRKLL